MGRVIGIGGVLAATALAGAPGLVGAQVSGATTLVSLAASASGMHVIVAVPNFVVVDRFIDGGGPTAQATLSTLEGPSSFAAQPYPGEIAIAFPGLLKVVGFPVDVPPYPFYVNASATKPEGKLTQPGMTLSATAAATDAAASAESGQAGEQAVMGHARSTAHTWLDGDTYRSEAVNSEDLFRLGPLKLAGVRSKAVASVPAKGGAATLGSSLEIGAASVNDVPVTFTPEGVTLAGSKVPLPKDNPFTKALGQAGLSVEYLAATTTQDTVVSPGLRIRAVQTFPGVDKQLQVTYLIGEAVAHGTVSALAGDGGLPVGGLPLEGGVGAGGTGGGSAGSDGLGQGTPDAGSATGTGSVGGGSAKRSSGRNSGLFGVGGGTATGPGGGAVTPATDAPAPAGEATAPSTPAGDAAAAGGPETALGISERDLATTSAKSIYLVVAGAALLAALALHALRQLGVRAPARIGG